MIYEGFMFFNELDLLEIRLHELDKLVDKFILVESHIKHDGGPKPLYYGDNLSRFSEFNHKIIHIIADDISPSLPHKPWPSRKDRDDNQRNAIARGLRGASNDDIFIHSDTDEIINSDLTLEFINGPDFDPNVITGFDMHLLYYYFNLRMISSPWCGSTMTRVGNIGKILDLRNKRLDMILHLYHYGWHFSYMGPPSQILLKANTMCDTEPHRYTLEEVVDCVNNKKDIGNLAQSWRGPHDFEWVPISILPQYIQNNLVKFNSYIGKPNDI